MTNYRLLLITYTLITRLDFPRLNASFCNNILNIIQFSEKSHLFRYHSPSQKTCNQNWCSPEICSTLGWTEREITEIGYVGMRDKLHVWEESAPPWIGIRYNQNSILSWNEGQKIFSEYTSLESEFYILLKLHTESLFKDPICSRTD